MVEGKLACVLLDRAIMEGEARGGPSMVALAPAPRRRRWGSLKSSVLLH